MKNMMVLGYPEGLKGENISVISRIMALIDVYDALANDRIYKKAMPYDEVEKLINDGSGKAFDPKVVNIFNLVKGELKNTNELHKDNLYDPNLNRDFIDKIDKI